MSNIIEQYRKAAEQGDAQAQNNLGECYYNGQGVEQDYKKAVEWYIKAVVNGHKIAHDHFEEIYRQNPFEAELAIKILKMKK